MQSVIMFTITINTINNLDKLKSHNRLSNKQIETETAQFNFSVLRRQNKAGKKPYYLLPCSKTFQFVTCRYLC